MNYNRIYKKEYCKCPKCGSDAEVDTDKVLTTYPPKYRAVCPNCGEVCYPFTHETYYKCEEEKKEVIGSELATEDITGVATATIKVPNQSRTNIVKSCMVCGETVRELDPKLMENSAYYGQPEICDKCKAAIMAMRDFIYPPEEEEK